MEKLVDTLSIPGTIAIFLVAAYLIMQIIGEIVEFKGKIVPEFIKIRKLFIRKKQEKKKTQEALSIVGEVQKLLKDVNSHYSKDNITKRDQWMDWVNDRAMVYDESVKKLDEVIKTQDEMIKVQKELSAKAVDNGQILLDLSIESKRNKILEFASDISNNKLVSREQYNRIYRTYEEYEAVLEKNSMTNGQVDIAKKIIDESYRKHLEERTFLEDINGY